MNNIFDLFFSKLLIPACFILCCSTAAMSQTGSVRRYSIKIDQAVTFNTDSEAVFIKRICAATMVNYNAYTRYFEVLTLKDLNRNVIEGKLFKHATPMQDYIFNGIETNNGASPVLQPHQ